MLGDKVNRLGTGTSQTVKPSFLDPNESILAVASNILSVTRPCTETVCQQFVLFILYSCVSCVADHFPLCSSSHKVI
jgi:hypothetical protein